MIEGIYAHPDEIKKEIKRCPVAIVPWGAFEWHGPHLPLGTDGLKAVKISELVAEKLGGGVIFPPVYFGHKTLKKWKGFPFTIETRPETVREILWDLMVNLEQENFRLLIIMAGHFGRTHQGILRSTIEEFNQSHTGPMTIWMVADYHLVEDLGFSTADHAGPYETTLMMYLYPDLVHMENLKVPPDESLESVGIFGGDPRKESSYESGKKTTGLIVDRLVSRIKEFLDKSAKS